MNSVLENAIPALPVALPLLAAACVAGLRKWLSRAAADTISILSAACTLALTATLLVGAMQQTEVYWFGSWSPRGQMALGITFVIDPAGAGIATLAALLSLLALIFSWRFTDSGGHHSHPLMLVFLAAMCGFALTGDIFNMFVFFELMSTAAFALCGLKTHEPAPLQGAFNFAVTNTIAAFMVLTGIAMLYAVTGALNMAQIGALLGQRHDPLVLFAATLLTCGFLVKAAIVPFHFWLPDAHAVAPTPVCVMFSGLMVELGVYAVLRLNTVLFQQSYSAHSSHLRGILITLGAVTTLLGGVMCYAQHHLKRLLAFSTISHAGLMLIAIAINTPLAIGGFLVYLLAHALVKSGLFFTSGILLHRLRTVSEPMLFGRGKMLHFTAGLWFLGALGLAGCPPFSTMLGESLTSAAAESLGMKLPSYLFLIGGALTAAAVFRVGMHTFLGWGTQPVTDHSAIVDELPEDREDNRHVFWFHFTPPAICILAAAGIAFVPHLVPEFLRAANLLHDQAGYIHTVFTGATAAETAIPAPTSHLAAELRGLAASGLGLLLALTSVFRVQLTRWLRIGAFMEGPLDPLRKLQSGHPGDYVLWLTVGVATIGASFLLLLR